MKFASSAKLLPSAPNRRIVDLIEEFKRFDCEVQVIRGQQWRLDFDVPEDLGAWITCGGLAALLDSYADTVEWAPHFRERFGPLEQPQLPRQAAAPRPAGRGSRRPERR